MAKNMKQRRCVVLYSIHGRGNLGVIDYQEFIVKLTNLASTPDSKIEIFGDVVAITASQKIGEGIYALRFICGSKVNEPVFYNQETGIEEQVRRDEGIYAAAVWAVINTDTRLVAIESKKPGVPVKSIERYLQLKGRELGLQGLIVDLNQVTTSHFDKAVMELETVKAVTVAVNQPNLDWSDDCNLIHEYAEESNAGSAELTLSAPRGQSLSRENGIIQDVVGLARKKISSLKNVIVEGRRAGETVNTKINLKRYQQKQHITLNRNGTAEEDLDAIKGPVTKMVSERDKDNENPDQNSMNLMSKK